MENTSKLIKTYNVGFSESLFIGIKYTEKDKKDNTFGWLWRDWFENNRFDPIEKNIKKPNGIDEGEAYCGLCIAVHSTIV